MDKDKVLETITGTGLVAIIRTDTSAEALKIADMCAAAGVKAIEISLTLNEGIDVIKKLSKQYENTDVIIGAGTVLNPDTAALAIDAGARYIISPCLNTKTVEYCVKNNIACLPGAMTVKEVVDAINVGADIIKVFPAELFGPPIIKAIKGPLPFAMLMPTGGVTCENVGQWIKAGSVAVGVGNSLISPAKSGNISALQELVTKYLDEIKKARST
ncbi:MAG: bifunctional 4-hydroxy-2-oxoglutarate aldolase/2-dehydro-3-deoxy-phosphogluconate aldolase [Bacillota bacterium]